MYFDVGLRNQRFLLDYGFSLGEENPMGDEEKEDLAWKEAQKPCLSGFEVCRGARHPIRTGPQERLLRSSAKLWFYDKYI